jgi:hypothetical protein
MINRECILGLNSLEGYTWQVYWSFLLDGLIQPNVNQQYKIGGPNGREHIWNGEVTKPWTMSPKLVC